MSRYALGYGDSRNLVFINGLRSLRPFEFDGGVSIFFYRSHHSKELFCLNKTIVERRAKRGVSGILGLAFEDMSDSAQVDVYKLETIRNRDLGMAEYTEKPEFVGSFNIESIGKQSLEDFLGIVRSRINEIVQGKY